MRLASPRSPWWDSPKSPSELQLLLLPDLERLLLFFFFFFLSFLFLPLDPLGSSGKPDAEPSEASREALLLDAFWIEELPRAPLRCCKVSRSDRRFGSLAIFSSPLPFSQHPCLSAL